MVDQIGLPIRALFFGEKPLKLMPQWKFSCQKGMKNIFWAKAGFEPETAEFPQRDELTIEPHS